jgi:hypothetical protein
MFGHSFGGAASAEAAYRNQRILAAITMDINNRAGGVIENSITQPLMMIFSEAVQTEWGAIGDEIIAKGGTLCEGSEAGYLWILLESADLTFTDLALLVPLGRGVLFEPANVGIIDAGRAHEIISTYAVGFFDKHVKGEEVLLLDGHQKNILKWSLRHMAQAIWYAFRPMGHD